MSERRRSLTTVPNEEPVPPSAGELVPEAGALARPLRQWLDTSSFLGVNHPSKLSFSARHDALRAQLRLVNAARYSAERLESERRRSESRAIRAQEEAPAGRAPVLRAVVASEAAQSADDSSPQAPPDQV